MTAGTSVTILTLNSMCYSNSEHTILLISDFQAWRPIYNISSVYLSSKMKTTHFQASMF